MLKNNFKEQPGFTMPKPIVSLEEELQTKEARLAELKKAEKKTRKKILYKVGLFFDLIDDHSDEINQLELEVTALKKQMATENSALYKIGTKMSEVASAVGHFFEPKEEKTVTEKMKLKYGFVSAKR